MKSQFDLVALHRLSLILDEFRKVYPEMPMQMAASLITVAVNPGLTVTEVAKLAGNTLSSTSRHMEVLGPYNEVKKMGLGIIEYSYDAADRRRKVVVLTPAGTRVFKTLVDLINR